ncbi:hypothetical protein [Pseudoalteromonas sp. T1lg21]|uniref:hypothetical protein n=1 Tax=Pseudoalteromonas sp. T1lg21 TaxID=2077095 RepID=UPI000CF62DCF|nr:hypothetical protein [Pseudoalteromonas sp. T1lg21]
MNNTLNPKFSEVTIETITTKKEWIANDITSNFWLVAKSGYSNNVDSNTPRDKLEKISFEKEICPGGFLTDSLFSNLLIDLKQCLINIFESGSSQKPYRLRSICNNIIYLIISVNEHRSEYGLPPILAFNQITEDDIYDFLKSFTIEPELINSVLSELISYEGKPKKQDWLNIKNKYSIRSKTLSILKSRITSSKNSKLYKSSKTEIKKFEDANINRDICSFHAPNKKTIQNYISDINHIFHNSNHLMFPLQFSPYELFSSEESLANIFKEFQRNIKTSIVPLEVAFHLISNALKFQYDYGESILKYLRSVDEHYKINTAHLKKSTLLKDCNRREKLFHEVEIPEPLTSLNIKTLGLEKEPKTPGTLSLTQVIYLYAASMYILLASFSATREYSLLLLKRDCFNHSPLDGLFDISFKQQKANTTNMLQTIHRPIPKPIYRLGLQYAEFSQYLENRFKIFNEDHESYLFTSFHGIKKIITRHFDRFSYDNAPNHFYEDKMQSILDFFSDWTDVPLIEGKRWYVNDHQFRRLFAVLYFNLTDETGIEELAWFLGHEDLEMAFHYAEVDPSSEWIDEAIISISKRATSINRNLNADKEIAKIIEVSKEKSLKLNLQLEGVIYEAINERIKTTGEKVHFKRVDDKDIYFYFSME